MAFPLPAQGEGSGPTWKTDMCHCADGVSECMARPAVADLYCDQPVDCCTPGSLSLQSITPEVLASPETGDADEQALIARYERAIEIAHNQLSGHVCMARYAAGCTLRVSVCVESANCNCPNPCGPNQCDRTTAMLDELAACVSPNRILSASIDAGVLAVDDDPAEEDGWMLTTHRTWQISGPLVVTGGTFILDIVTKPARSEWLEAVKALACTLVPGTHAEGCNRETPEFGPPPGFLNNAIADTLDTSCVLPDLRFGSIGSNIRYKRWVATV